MDSIIIRILSTLRRSLNDLANYLWKIDIKCYFLNRFSLDLFILEEGEGHKMLIVALFSEITPDRT